MYGPVQDEKSGSKSKLNGPRKCAKQMHSKNCCYSLFHITMSLISLQSQILKWMLWSDFDFKYSNAVGDFQSIQKMKFFEGTPPSPEFHMHEVYNELFRPLLVPQWMIQRGHQAKRFVAKSACHDVQHSRLTRSVWETAKTQHAQNLETSDKKWNQAWRHAGWKWASQGIQQSSRRQRSAKSVAWGKGLTFHHGKQSSDLS